MKIAPEDWPTLSRLLDEALDQSASERHRWLSQLPTDYQTLQPILRHLLERHAEAETRDFLGSLPQLLAADDAVDSTGRSGFEPGAVIGRYRLVRPLGQGGMGEVWLATARDGALSRPVALKLPHAHLLSGALRQRFERERDILAALSHPHIAPLFDAGVSESGHPYLAMEWIDGVPITQYCREARLSVDERLALFRQVLDAVHYAHARFIAHRDLKPSNILVTRDGQAKLLDFGVAKLLSGESLGLDTELTQLGGRAATPDYAAPEQLAGQPITTAVDSYALGVVLFELLTGARPFGGADRNRTWGAPRGDRSSHPEAPLASTRLTEVEAESIGGLRSAQLKKLLQGDLDAIIAKALEPDPAQRYGSVAAFADDLQRYRRHEPVSARHIGKLTTLLRLARRHRVGAALTLSLAVSLVAGAGGIAWEAIAARREASRAELEARRAESEARRAESEAEREKATKDFLISVFRASDPRIPSDTPRGTITAKQLLDASSGRIGEQFRNDPETQIELLGTSAEIYDELREHARYLELHRAQMNLIKSHYGELHPLYIDGVLEDADKASDDDTNAPEAERLLRQAESLIQRANLTGSVLQARWLLEKSAALRTDGTARPQRIALLKQAIALYEKLAPTDRAYFTALNELGLAYCDDNDFVHATEFHERAISLFEKVRGPVDSDLGTTYSNLGLDRWYMGDYAGAERAMARSVEIARQTVGETDDRYWSTVVPYAKVIHQSGDRKRSHEMFEKLLANFPSGTQRQLSSAEQSTIANAREVYAACLAIEGRPREAIPALEAALHTYEHMQVEDYDLRRVQLTLGDVYAAVGREADARKAFKAALDDYAAHETPDSIISEKARERWARFLMQAGDARSADEQFRRVIDLDHHRNLAPTALAYSGLAQLAIARHDATSALQLSSEAITTFENVTGLRDVRTGPFLWRIRAEALLLAGDASAARSWAQRALEADRRYDDPASQDIADAEATLRAIDASGLKH